MFWGQLTHEEVVCSHIAFVCIVGGGLLNMGPRKLCSWWSAKYAHSLWSMQGMEKYPIGTLPIRFWIKELSLHWNYGKIYFGYASMQYLPHPPPRGTHQLASSLFIQHTTFWLLCFVNSVEFYNGGMESMRTFNQVFKLFRIIPSGFYPLFYKIALFTFKLL